MIYVRDIVSNGILSWEDICQKCGLTIPFLTYYKIIAAIPNSWRIIINAKDTFWLDFLDTEETPSQIAYWAFIAKQPFDNNATKLRWQFELSTEWSDKEWEMICSRSNKVTLCTQA